MTKARKPGEAPAPGAVRVTLAGASAGMELPPVVAEPAARPATEEAWPARPPVRWLGAGSQPGSRRCEVVVDGWRFELDVEPAARAALRERARRGRQDRGTSGPTEVRAIIPGVVASVAVGVGDRVTAGQELLAIEAMKMQNELRAPRDGRVQRVAAAPGGRIEVGDVLVVIE